MKNLAIARRYAKALLLIGKEDGLAETYREELEGFTDLLKQEPGLEQAINNPLYDSDGRKRVLQTVVDKLELSKVMTSYVMLLFEKGRFRFIHDISEFYQQLADELKGMVRASVVSAVELTNETVDKIRETLSARTGKEVVLDIDQDPGLIGGIVTRIGDLVLDGSIRTQLLNMEESLKRGESA